VANWLTEIYFINRYGFLEEFAWRKGKPLAEEWGKVLVAVKNIIGKLKVKPACLLYLIGIKKLDNLDYEQFGLIRWKAQRVPEANFENLFKFYQQEHIRASEVQASVNVSYTPKVKTSKTLAELLAEL
jgi:hypothetical protein